MSNKQGRTIITIISVIVLALVIWIERGTFIAGTRELSSARLDYTIAAAMTALLAVFPGAVVYHLLTRRKLFFKRTLLVQMANNFTGRLLPAGTGGMATMVRYLSTQGHSLVESSSIVSVNYLASFLSLISIIIAATLASGKNIESIFAIKVSPIFVAVIAGVIALFIAAAFTPSSKNKIKKSAKEFWLVYIKAISHGWNFALAILASGLFTACLVLALIFCVAAFGQSITILQAVIVITLGASAAAITPTPGSLGGVELGLIFALQASGIDSNVALPAALLYRFVTFWIPMIPGFFAFQYALKKKYL